MPHNKELNQQIEIILLKYGNRVLDVVNGKENITLGELVDPTTKAIEDIINQARIVEAKYISWMLWDEDGSPCQRDDPPKEMLDHLSELQAKPPVERQS